MFFLIVKVFSIVVSKLRPSTDPVSVLSMFMLSLYLVLVSGRFEWKRTYVGFALSFGYFSITYSNVRREMIRSQSIGLTTPLMCACPGQDFDFHRHMSWPFIIFNELG